MHTDRAVAFSTLIVGSGFLVANGLSLAREMVATSTFGVGAGMDAYFIALVVPTFFLLFSGGMGDAFIPAFVRIVNTRPEGEVREFHDRYVSWVIVYALGAILAINLAAPWVVPLLAAGAPPETRRLATTMVRLLSLLVLLDSLGGVATMTYHSRRRFAVPSFTPIVVTLVTIVSMVTLHRTLGIFSVVAGLLAGSALSVAVLLVLLPRAGRPFRFTLDLRDAEIRGIFAQSLPLMASRLMSQTNGIIDKVMAAFLSVGSVSVLSWASRMYSFCYQIFIYSVYRVLIPHFSGQVARGDWGAVRATLDKALRYSALVLLPISCAVAVFSEALIRVLFERGSFTAEATRLTATALRFSILGLFCDAANSIFFSILLALKETNRVFLVGLVAGFFPNIALNYWFMRSYGIAGIALSTAVVSGIYTVVLFFVTRRQVGGFLQRGFAVYLAKVGAAALATTLSAVLLARRLDALLDPRAWGQQLAFWTLIALTSVALYVAALALLRVRELNALVLLLRRQGGA